MNDKTKNNGQLQFEIYQLHSELAEKISTAREGSNKLYAGMITTIVAISTYVNQILPGYEYNWVLPVLGLVISLSWLLTLNSATGKLYAKHYILLELEKELPFHFFEKENEVFVKGPYLRTRYTYMVLPICFIVLSIALLLHHFGMFV